MTEPRLRLPFGSEFSPSQIDLARLLGLAAGHEGDVSGMQAAIRETFFAAHGGAGSGAAANRDTLAMNCRLGLRAYGIIDDAARLTGFGRDLLARRDDAAGLHDALAGHILRNLHGMALIQCVRDLTVAGETVDLTSLRAALARRGIDYPSGGKHPSMMRLWLAKAGVFVGPRWRIDEARLQAVLGADPAMFDALAGLTREQRAFAQALANSGVRAPQPASRVVRLATAAYGVRFPQKSLPKLVLDALVAAGLITAAKTTAGRGAKPFLVAPTEKLVAALVDPLLAQLSGQTDPRLTALLRKPMAEIRAELDSPDRHVSGLALEALAFRLMGLLGLDYLATRLRGAATGGAEVDLIFHTARLAYARWQVQCKNTARVALDDVAKEVGLTAFLKSNVIVIVTTGTIGAEARRYADRVMRDSNLAIAMIEGADLDRIGSDPARIADVFEREARMAMQLKPLELSP